MSKLLTLDEACLAIVDCEHKTSPIDEQGECFAVGTPAMRGNVIDYSQARRIGTKTFEEWTRRLTPMPGDLLFAREAPVGPVVQIPEGVPIAPGQRTVLLRANPKFVDASYLYYLLTSPLQQSRLLTFAEGSTVPHLNVAEVRSFVLPELPPLNEQRAIAATLGALDDKIESNRRAVSKSTELVMSLAEKLLLNSTSTPCTLNDVVFFNRLVRKPEKGRSLEYVDIASVGSGVIHSAQKMNWEEAPSRARRGVSDGDVIYSTVRPNRRVFSLVMNPADEMVVSTGFAVMTPKNRIFGSSFLRTVVAHKEFSDYLESVAHGSAYPAVSVDAMSKFELNVPSPQDLAKFEEQTLPIWRRAQQADLESKRLEVLRDALLPELLSGRIRVVDAA